jgi:protein gp37
MADKTSIEWTDATWNPVTGCAKVSPGCDHCYAETFAERWRGTPGHHFEQGFDLRLWPDRLVLPLKWRKPRRIFVNSMSDLFHDDVPDGFIHQVFAVMAATPQHTYQILTKRHGRMRTLLRDECRCGGGHQPGIHFKSAIDWVATPHSPEYVPGLPLRLYHQIQWPLPNVWVGVSVENQQWADIRIPALRDTPAAVRWLSCEPLLGPVDLSQHLVPAEPAPAFTDAWDRGDLGWIVTGGESGPGARPMQPSWALSLRDQCADAGVPFLFKQWGEWVPPTHMTADTFMSWDCNHGTSAYDQDQPWRVGKKAAGRLLDGKVWDQYPAAVSCG